MLACSSSGSTRPRSHDSLLSPVRTGLKTLFRADFYTFSKLVPRELLLLGMHSSLPPCSLKWWACHSQGVSKKSTGQRGRQGNKLRRLVSSCFSSQRQGSTEGMLWLVITLCLSRQHLSHIAYLHTIYYWTLLEQQSNLIKQLKELLWRHPYKCDVIFSTAFLHFFSSLSLSHQLLSNCSLALMLTTLDVIGTD